MSGNDFVQYEHRGLSVKIPKSLGIKLKKGFARGPIFAGGSNAKGKIISVGIGLETHPVLIEGYEMQVRSYFSDGLAKYHGIKVIRRGEVEFPYKGFECFDVHEHSQNVPKNEFSYWQLCLYPQSNAIIHVAIAVSGKFLETEALWMQVIQSIHVDPGVLPPMPDEALEFKEYESQGVVLLVPRKLRATMDCVRRSEENNDVFSLGIRVVPVAHKKASQEFQDNPGIMEDMLAKSLMHLYTNPALVDALATQANANVYETTVMSQSEISTPFKGTDRFLKERVRKTGQVSFRREVVLHASPKTILEIDIYLDRNFSAAEFELWSEAIQTIRYTPTTESHRA